MSRSGIEIGGAGIGRGGSIDNKKSGIVLDDFDRLFANLDPVKVPLYQGKNPKQQSAARVKEVIEIARARLEALSSVDSFGAKLDMANIGRVEEKIQELLASEKYEESLGYCDQIIMALPKDQGGYILKGQAYLNIDANIALVYLRKALELNLATNSERHRGDIYNFISIALRKLGHFDDAIGYAQKAIDIYPDVTMYYLNKDVAIRDKYLYFNSLLTEPREERMKLTELIELKVTVLSRLSNIEARIGEDEVRGIKELMKGLSLLELSEENAREMAKELLEIANLISKVMETNGIKIDDGLSEALLALTGISEATVKAEPTKELRAAAGGAGEEEAQDMEIDAGDGGALSSAATISASGGATSFATEVVPDTESVAIIAQKHESEYFAAAKTAIENMHMTEAEIKAAVANLVATHTKTPDEIYYELNKLRKAGKWDELCDFMVENKEQISLIHVYTNIAFGVDDRNFKILYTWTKLYPFMKEYFAADAIISRLNDQIASDDEQIIELEQFKEDVALVESLGLDMNKVFTINPKEGVFWESPIIKAASLSNYADDVQKPAIYIYIAQRLKDGNYQMSKEDVIQVLKYLNRDSYMDMLKPLLPIDDQTHFKEIKYESRGLDYKFSTSLLSSESSIAEDSGVREGKVEPLGVDTEASE